MICKKKDNAFLFCAVSFLITLFSISAIFAITNIVPFDVTEEKTLATADAWYQYLDFFAFLKDLLSGKQSLGYSFANGLGQNNIGFFSYYLTSPFNLLIIFFQKEDIHVFYNLIFALKVAMSAATFSYFQIRWKDEIQNPNIFTLLISVSYGLMQYNIVQSTNIMWLDGVYMLPLILLGTSNILRGKSGVYFSVTVFLSIVFNWYSAGINCLFSICWFAYELLRGDYRENTSVVTACVRFFSHLLLGVMLSAFFFLPAIFALSQGKGGSLNWKFLTDYHLMGNPISVLSGYTIGATSWPGFVSLFCGSLVLVGVICFFVSEQMSYRVKLFTGVFLLFCVLIYYSNGLFGIFSLLKNAESYWYRYSYVSICVLCAIASENFSQYNGNRKVVLFAVCLTVGIIQLLCTNKYYQDHVKLALISELYLLLHTVIIISLTKTTDSIHHYLQTEILWAVLSISVISEMTINASLLIHNISNASVREFERYEHEEIELIDSIRHHDPDAFRMSQLQTRSMNYQGTTANFNESLAFNYWSVEQYTSSASLKQLEWCDKVGYYNWVNSMTVKATCIIPVDSFLGVKYILSPYPIDELELIDDIPAKNKKQVYLNPYALPFAFRVQGDGTVDESKDPFEHMNHFYSSLLGRDVTVFHPLQYSRTESENKYIYKLSGIEDTMMCYGNLPNKEVGGNISIEGGITYPYSHVHAPTVFYIPTSAKNSGEVKVTLSLNNPEALLQEEFYYLDLEEFTEIIKQLKNQSADDIKIRNGYLECNIEGDKDSYLVTSVCAEKGWKIRVNGSVIEPSLLDETFIMIPLEEGNNHIEMVYHIVYIYEGATVSIVALCVLILIKRKMMKKPEKSEC